KYRTLKFAGKLLGTNSPNPFYGPRDFKLQYSLNNSTWVDVPGGAMTAYNGMAGWNSYSNIALPVACDNQPTVYLRLLMTSNTAVNGSPVGTGQSHFDDVNITGVSDPEAPTDIALSSSSILLPTASSQAASGTTVGTFSSTDFNLGNTHTYTLVSGTGSTHNSSFSISGGTLSTATNLGAGTYSIRVRSTDNGALWFEKIMTIIVSAPDAILSGTRSRVSAMGPNGNPAYGSNTPPSIAYNRTANEYLVVWPGDDNTPPLVDNELEIYAQRINAATGAANGSRIRVSTMGTDGTTTHRGLNPVVTWNATNNEYFVVWQGDHNSGSLVTTEDEIWGQRINGATGLLLGSMVRISTMGPDGNNAFDAFTPDVDWSATDNQYLVVWRADDNTAPLVDNEYEIFAQRVSNTGVLTGSRIQVSAMGTAGNTSFAPSAPAVTWNANNNEFMTVWQSDDNTLPQIDNEFEIFGQRISATGVLAGSRIRISTMGTDGNTAFTAMTSDVAWSSHANEYLVIWRGDDNTAPLVDNEYEVFGQRLSNTGALTGSRIRISDMGPDGNTLFSAATPKLMYHTNLREYWIVWAGDDDATSVDGENEIFMQRINTAGAEVGNNDVRLSYMGTANSTAFNALQPAIAYNSYNISAHAVWQGDDNTAPLVDNEMEVFGQSLFVTPSTLPLNWLSFTAAKKANGSIDLNWETGQEKNTRYFVVQHSTGNGSWKVIDTVLTNQNVTGTSRYNTVHGTPAKGANYYRLLQVDEDGKNSYSKTVSVGIKIGAASLYPNPVENSFTLQLPVPATSQLSLYNSAGVLVMHKQCSGSLVTINVQALAAGQYSLLAVQDGVQYQQVFLKK
ncbi:MAG TPA: T9SS type A sorting domain-containing protein, partial [Flavisolibacter sp.]|nr:T9SS type A sorting domain-containing protein [Flavisolibacter sp.]